MNTIENVRVFIFVSIFVFSGYRDVLDPFGSERKVLLGVYSTMYVFGKLL